MTASPRSDFQGESTGASLATAVLLALVMLAGCDTSPPLPPVVTQQATTRIESTAESEQQTPAAEPAAVTAVIEPLVEPSEGGRVIEETWDAYSMQGSRVGYAHTTIAEVDEEGQKLHPQSRSDPHRS